MIVKVPTNRLIVSSLNRYAEFYQQLLSNISSFKELGNRLVIEAETVWSFRQTDKLEGLAAVLSNTPIKEYQLIGQYYLGLCAYRNGENTREVFERVIEQSKNYKARALISLAAVEARNGDYVSELSYYSEAVKWADNPTTFISAAKGIAVIKSREGYGRQALKDLENLSMLARHASPKFYYDYLNSLAVELGEAGRKYEARNVIKHVIASPFAFAYPEWQDTASRLKEANRSFVAVPQIVPKHVETPKPVSKPKQPASQSKQPASVLTFPKLKEAPLPEKPERLTPQQYVGLSSKDRREMIFAALKSGAIREDDYYKMMVMLGLLKGGPADEIIDLEDDRVLDDIAVVWSAQIGGEVLVGFLSALRDCDDSVRHGDIIDRLIRKIFHESQTCGITEDEWRLRFERRLPKK